MKKVVLFKSVSEEYKKAFNDKDYDVIFVEPLQFEMTSASELSARLARDDYAGLVLSSPRAVEAVSRCWDPARSSLWSTKRVYTVGEVSAQRVKHLLGLDALGTTAGNAENLAKIILLDNPESSKILFPCGNLRSETLPDALTTGGLQVDSLTVYVTTESKHLRSALINLDNSVDEPCCLVFFSPSGCEYVHRQLQTFNNRLFHLPHFAIGNSTAHKIENLGIEIAGVAAKPNAESVIQSVENFFTVTHRGS